MAPNRPTTPDPCCICAAPSTRLVGIRPACEQCAEPLHQAALAKRDALLVALRQMARAHEMKREAA